MAQNFGYSTTAACLKFKKGWAAVVDSQITGEDDAPSGEALKAHLIKDHFLVLTAGEAYLAMYGKAVIRQIIQKIDIQPGEDTINEVTTQLEAIVAERCKKPMEEARISLGITKKLDSDLILLDRTNEKFAMVYSLSCAANSVLVNCHGRKIEKAHICGDFNNDEAVASKLWKEDQLQYPAMCSLMGMMKTAAQKDKFTGGHAILIVGGPKIEWDIVAFESLHNV